MLAENRKLLAIGTLYWLGLGVIVAGFTAFMFTDNATIGIAGAGLTVAMWAIALIVGTGGKDRYGKVRTGIDRGR